jgi:transcriptional regulator with XRE-family HTH domain
MRNDIGLMISTMRRSRGMTQTDLADKMRVSRSTIAMWESNKREPDLESLEALADIFNVDIGSIVGSIDMDTDYELLEIRDSIHDNPDLKTMFDYSKKLRPNQLKQMISFLKTLTGDDKDNEGC